MAQVVHSRSLLSVETLWEAYLHDRSPERANALLVHYLPLVRFAALRISRRWCGFRRADFDDLIQFGAMGLRTAVASFDPLRGVKFETYCARRIHGAMLDGIKSQEWAPREERRKLACLAAAHTCSRMETGLPAGEDTLAARVGVCTDEVHKLERAAASLVRVSLGGGASSDEGPALHDDRTLRPEQILNRHDVRAVLLQDLSRAQRLVLILHYYENMTMREIGATLGVSGTRVSQLHTQALERLRRKLHRREDAADLLSV
jgi:RNA polymerase sigma factor for flagellar operon FliA